MYRLTREQIIEAFRALDLETPEARLRFARLQEFAHLAEPPGFKDTSAMRTSNTTLEEDAIA